MPRCAEQRLVVSGLGVTSALGPGRAAFAQALRAGRSAFGMLEREGRSGDGPDGAIRFVGAEIDARTLPAALDERQQRTASWSTQVAAATLAEAYADAALDTVAPERLGLIVGGSNLQQRELAVLHDAYANRRAFVRPSYASTFLDTDLVGACTERFGIRGPSYSVGAASASGQMAIIAAATSVLAGEVDTCIALGALMDLSFWELQALRSAGALGGLAAEPARACRPFDRDRDGFIYGEACAALVVEREETALARGRVPYGRLLGWGVVADASRGTSPSVVGEVDAIGKALHNANLSPADVDYFNSHGTGSLVGDETELQALRRTGLAGAYINATKSITGHGLTAAGAVEVAATLLQMQGGWLHPTLNLDTPIDPELNWVVGAARACDVEFALCLSLGFGGTNTALCLRNYRAS